MDAMKLFWTILMLVCFGFNLSTCDNSNHANPPSNNGDSSPSHHSGNSAIHHDEQTAENDVEDPHGNYAVWWFVAVGVTVMMVYLTCLTCCMCKTAYCHGKCKGCSHGRNQPRCNIQRRNAQYCELQQIPAV